jgi:hypothetical protein
MMMSAVATRAMHSLRLHPECLGDFAPAEQNEGPLAVIRSLAPRLWVIVERWNASALRSARRVCGFRGLAVGGRRDRQITWPSSSANREA